MPLPEVLSLVGVTRSTLCRWMEAGLFLKHISVGGNTVVWVESAVTAWMEDRMAPDDPVQGRSQAFVDVRNLLMGYLPTISENKSVIVRWGASEHEIDLPALRFC